mgnify:CR=1 FL=1
MNAPTQKMKNESGNSHVQRRLIGSVFALTLLALCMVSNTALAKKTTDYQTWLSAGARATLVDSLYLDISVMQRIPKLLNGIYTNRYVSEKMEYNLWLSGNTMNFIALVVFNLYAMFNLK